MLELDYQATLEPAMTLRDTAEPDAQTWAATYAQGRLSGVMQTLGRCAALYDTLHTEEMGKLLHMGSADVHVLTLLAHAGPLGLARLTELSTGSPAGTDAALERLVDHGLVERHRGQSDRRTVRLQADTARAASVLRTPTGTLLALMQTLSRLHVSELAQACDMLATLDASLTAEVRANSA